MDKKYSYKVRAFALANLPADAPEWIKKIEYNPEKMDEVFEFYFPEDVPHPFRYLGIDGYRKLGYPPVLPSVTRDYIITSALEFDNLIGVLGKEGYIEAIITR